MADTGSGGGSVLSDAQIIALWIKAGGPMSTAATALAHAQAESSGRVSVTSPNPGGGINVGLYQLDTEGVGAGHTQAQLSDPLTNTQITVKATNGGRNWGEWSDDWQAQIGAAQSAVQSFQGQASSHPGGIDGLADDVLSGLGSIGSDISSAVSGAVGQLLQLPSQVTGFLTSLEAPVQGLMWFVNPANWARIIAGITGLVLLSIGLVTLGLAA